MPHEDKGCQSSDTDLFEQLFCQFPMGMAIATLDYTIVETNESFCQMLGYTREELRGKNMDQIVYPQDIHLTDLLGEQMLSHQKAKHQMRKRYVHKDGRVMPMLVTASLLNDMAGQPQHVIRMIQSDTPVGYEESPEEAQERIRRAIFGE